MKKAISLLFLMLCILAAGCFSRADTATANDPDSFTFVLDGDTYTLPMPYSDIEAMGWQPDLDFDFDFDTFDVNGLAGTLVFPMKKGDLTCSMSFANFDVNAQPVKQCHVVEVYYNVNDSTRGDASFTLPGGLQRGVATVEDVAVQMKGSGLVPYFPYDSLTFGPNLRDDIAAVTFDADNKLSGFMLRNAVEPEGFEQSKVADAPHDDVTSYVAPTAMPDDFIPGVFELGGVLYDMPVPVQLLKDAGWSKSYGLEGDVTGGESVDAHYNDGQKEIVISVRNLSNQAIKFSNGAAYNFTAKGADADMRVAFGIANGMAEQDLLDILDVHGVEYETRENALYREYSFTMVDTAGYGAYYNFEVSKDGVLENISVYDRRPRE